MLITLRESWQEKEMSEEEIIEKIKEIFGDVVSYTLMQKLLKELKDE